MLGGKIPKQCWTGDFSRPAILLFLTGSSSLNNWIFFSYIQGTGRILQHRIVWIGRILQDRIARIGRILQLQNPIQLMDRKNFAAPEPDTINALCLSIRNHFCSSSIAAQILPAATVIATPTTIPMAKPTGPLFLAHHEFVALSSCSSFFSTIRSAL